MPRDEAGMIGVAGAAPVLVFDLDGTILSVNSFPTWLLFLVGADRCAGSGCPTRARLSLRVLRLLVGRKLGRAAHEDRCAGRRRPGRHSPIRPDQTRLETFLLRRVRPALRPVSIASPRMARMRTGYCGGGRGHTAPGPAARVPPRARNSIRPSAACSVQHRDAKARPRDGIPARARLG